jgi:hypothetical protein
MSAPAETRTPAEALQAADDAHTLTVQAAVGGYGNWGDVRQAAEVVRQCRAAVKAAA